MLGASAIAPGPPMRLPASTDKHRPHAVNTSVQLGTYDANSTSETKEL